MVSRLDGRSVDRPFSRRVSGGNRLKQRRTDLSARANSSTIFAVNDYIRNRQLPFDRVENQQTLMSLTTDSATPLRDAASAFFPVVAAMLNRANSSPYLHPTRQQLSSCEHVGRTCWLPGRPYSCDIVQPH